MTTRTKIPPVTNWLAVSLPYTSSTISVIKNVMGTMKIPTEAEIPKKPIIFPPRRFTPTKRPMNKAKSIDNFLQFNIKLPPNKMDATMYYGRISFMMSMN
jgi:hypothetical protein